MGFEQVGAGKEQVEATVYPLQSEAGAAWRLHIGIEGICDGDGKQGAIENDVKHNIDRSGFAIKAKLNCILEDGLHEEGGNGGIIGIFFFEMHLQAVAEANRLNGEVGADIIEFFLHRQSIFRFPSDGRTEKIRQLADHILCFIGRYHDEGAYGVEAVVEEVGLQLLAELKELGFLEQCRGIGLLLEAGIEGRKIFTQSGVGGHPAIENPVD